jgi:hypothetical protein
MFPSCKLSFSPCTNTFLNDVVGIPVAAATIKANTRIDEIAIVE